MSASLLYENPEANLVPRFRYTVDDERAAAASLSLSLSLYKPRNYNPSLQNTEMHPPMKTWRTLRDGSVWRALHMLMCAPY